MYQIPLRFIKISRTVAICSTRITTIMSLTTRQGRLVYRKEKDNGTLVDATGSQKALSLLILDNGTVVASPYDIDRLVRSLRTQELRDEVRSAIHDKNNVQIYETNDASFEQVHGKRGKQPVLGEFDDLDGESLDEIDDLDNLDDLEFEEENVEESDDEGENT